MCSNCYKKLFVYVKLSLSGILADYDVYAYIEL